MNQVFLRSDGVDEDGVPVANNNLAMVVVDNTEKTKYYLAKKYLEGVAKKLGIAIELKPFVGAKEKYEAYYEPKRSASVYINDELVG